MRYLALVSLGVFAIAACGGVDGDTGLRRDVGDGGPGGGGTGGAIQVAGGTSFGGVSGGIGDAPGSVAGSPTAVDASLAAPCRQEAPPCSSSVDGGCAPYDWATATARYSGCSSGTDATTYLMVCDPYFVQVTATFEGDVTLYFDQSGKLLGQSAPTGSGDYSCISYDPTFTAVPHPLTCVRTSAECVPDAGTG